MTDFIADDIQGKFGSESSETAELLVGFDEPLGELEGKIQALGGEVDKQVGRTTLRVIIAESEFETLASLPSVISVEYDKEDVYTQEGNLKPDPASMM